LSPGVQQQPRVRPTHPFKVLYLFAGVQRQADVGCHLRRLKHEFNNACIDYSIKLELREVDIMRYAEDDLSNDTLQKEIRNQIMSKYWDVVIAAPPCHTFSRAMFSEHPGPRPIRDATWPRGFPWLEAKARRKAEIADSLVDFALSAIISAAAHEAICLLEFPEDL